MNLTSSRSTTEASSPEPQRHLSLKSGHLPIAYSQKSIQVDKTSGPLALFNSVKKATYSLIPGHLNRFQQKHKSITESQSTQSLSAAFLEKPTDNLTKNMVQYLRSNNSQLLKNCYMRVELNLDQKPYLCESVIFSPDGTWMVGCPVSLSLKKKIHLWDLEDITKVPQPKIFEINFPYSELSTFEFSLDSSLLIHSLKNGHIDVWDLKKRAAQDIQKVFQKDNVHSFLALPGQNIIAIHSLKKNQQNITFYLWQNNNNIKKFGYHIYMRMENINHRDIEFSIFSKNAKSFFIKTPSKFYIFTLDFEKPALKHPLNSELFYNAQSVHFSPNDKWLLLFNISRESIEDFSINIALFDLENPQLKEERILTNASFPSSILFAADNNFMAFVTSLFCDRGPSSLFLVNLNSRAPVAQRLFSGQDYLNLVTISPNSLWLFATASKSKKSLLWDLNNNVEIELPEEFPENVQKATFTNDHCLILIMGNNQICLCLFDADSLEKITVVKSEVVNPPNCSLNASMFSPQSNCFVGTLLKGSEGMCLWKF